MSDGLQDVELGGTRVPTSLATTPQVQAKETLPEGAIEGEMQGPDESSTMEVEQAMNAPKNAPSIGSVIIWAFVMTFLMLGPAWVLWLCGRFPEYTFSEVKIGSPLGNEQMEFIRISVFVYAAYMSFLLVEWLVSSLPARLLQLMKWLHHAPSVSTQRSIVYFVSARSYFTFAIWLVVLGVTGASLLYRTNFINAVGGSLLSKTSVKPAAEAVAEIKPVQNEWFYAECLVLVMAIFSVFYALANYLVELVKVNFHRMAYEERINTLNVNFQVITKLHSALRHPGKKIKIERGVEAYLIRDRLSELVSEKRASDLAANLYEKLVPTNRDYLTIDDFANYFEPTDLEESFRVFDKAGHGDLDRTEIRDAVLDVYQQRKAVAKGILNNNNIIRKLGGIMLAVAVFFTITFSVPIFNIGGAAIFAIYGLLWTAFGFLFQSTAKSCFESMIFVFVEHAYDVGDRVVVDDEFLTVETVEIFTTIFRRWDGTAVYIPNSVLSGKNIYNIRRSATQSDTIEISLAGTTSIDNVWTLRDRLAEFAQSEPKDYTGKVEISKFEVVEEKIVVGLAVEYKTNFQEAAVRAARKNKFMAMLKQHVSDLGIEQ